MTALRITPLSGALGASVEGLSLDDLAAQSGELRAAWFTYQVLVFPQVHLEPQQQLDLVAVFGRAEPHGADGDDTRQPTFADDDKLITVINSHTAKADIWHTDATFREEPPIGSMLQIVEKPQAGGDTMWVSTSKAYETLAAPLKVVADGLEAVHGRPPMTGTAVHPVVTEHPETGAKTLNVNRGWTSHLKGMPRLQGIDLLELFWNHIERPEHSMRWSWEIGDTILWDNRCTQHYAVYDYGDEPRSGHRVILQAH